MAYGITLVNDTTAQVVTLSVYGGPIVIQNFLFDVRPPGVTFPPVYDPGKAVVAVLDSRREVLPPPGEAIDPLPAVGCGLGDWSSEPELTGIWTNDGCPG